MINSKKFISIFIKLGVKYFTGVPDSVLNSFIKDLKQEKRIEHNPTMNEGSAIGLVQATTFLHSLNLYAKLWLIML